MIEKLHEKAETYFNEKADEFLYELKPDPYRQKHKVSNRKSSASHVFVLKHLTDKDIIEFTSTGYVDGFGRQVSRYFLLISFLLVLMKMAIPDLRSSLRLFTKKENLTLY